MSNKALILIAAIVTILLIVLVVNKCERPTIVTKPVDSVFYWKDKYSNEVASMKGKEEQFGYQEKKLLDSIAKLHNVKPQYVKEYVTVTEKGEAVITTVEKPVIRYVDSNGCPRVLFQGFENPYYIVEAQIDTKGDSSYVKLQTVDTLSVVWKEVKEGGLFNRKTFLQLDVTNKNPYNHITGLSAYRVPAAKPKKIGIGLQVGYGFSQGLQPQIYFGVGASYNIIRF